MKSKCDNTEGNTVICDNGRCIDEDDSSSGDGSSDKKWKVVIELNRTDPIFEMYDEIVDELTDLVEDEISVAIEYDDDGVMNRIIILVNDKKKADNIIVFLDECIHSNVAEE